jgi:hypothetical protein
VFFIWAVSASDWLGEGWRCSNIWLQMLWFVRRNRCQLDVWLWP